MKPSAYLLAALFLPLQLQAQESVQAAESICGTSIRGSKVKAGGILASPIMFVTAIDGTEIERARKNWNKPVCLSPGRHELDVGFNQAQYNGKALASLDVVEGHSYEIAFKGTWTKGFVYWLRDRDSGEALTMEAPVLRSNDHLFRVLLLAWLPPR